MPTLEDGRNAIEQGNLQQARLIFEAVLQETPRSPDAWLGLAEVLTDVEDKRICYENVLKIDKANPAAREGLRSLEPQANPLIAALQEKASVRVDDEEEFTAAETDDKASDRPTMIGSSDDITAAVKAANVAGAEGGPPTYALVAIGLVFSVVAFAVGGGVIYVVLESLAGG